jgi:PAS domain S-box-containing protein
VVYRYAHGADGKPHFEYLSAGIEQLNGVRVKDVLRDAGVLHRQILPEYIPQLVEAERRSARELSDFKMEVPMRHPDGEVRWMLLQSRPNRLPDGGVLWDGVQTDITERKGIEDALRESEEKFRTLFETMAEGFSIDEIICDEAGRPCDLRYLSVNPAFERHTGLKAADVVGRTIRELFPGAEPMWFERYGKVALTGEPAQFEGQFGPLGRWFEVSAYQTQPGRFAVVFFDITKRRRAEEELRASEGRLRLFIENAPASIAKFDRQMRYIAASRRWLEDYGITGGVAGRSHYELFPETPETWRDVHRRSLAGETMRSEGDRFERADGSVQWVKWEALPWRNASGEIGGILIATEDITERKRREEQVQLLLREVNHRSKNMLALVDAIAWQTAAEDPKDFTSRFSDRIGSLAASQDLLVMSEWRGVEIEALMRSQLAHFQDLIGTRITLEGPALQLSASAAQSFGMAIHELSTNAGKYGALSNAGGRVALSWKVEACEGAEDCFVLSWVERGGPPVSAPNRRGFGHTVTVSMPKMELDAGVELQYAPAGVSWRVACPAARVLEESGGGRQRSA